VKEKFANEEFLSGEGKAGNEKNATCEEHVRDERKLRRGSARNVRKPAGNVRKSARDEKEPGNEKKPGTEKEPGTEKKVSGNKAAGKLKEKKSASLRRKPMLRGMRRLF